MSVLEREPKRAERVLKSSSPPPLLESFLPLNKPIMVIGLACSKIVFRSERGGAERERKLDKGKKREMERLSERYGREVRLNAR